MVIDTAFILISSALVLLMTPALATGLFATVAINAGGANGLFYGNASLLGIQAISVGITWIYSFAVTFVILKILDKTMGLRANEDEEKIGLDISLHGERIP